MPTPDNPPENDNFLQDVIDGLRADQPAIPCKYLYDERGSELFDQICQTEDYYVTRADLALHEAHLDEFSERIGPRAHVIEFGSGSGIKTLRLLGALDSPRAYTPIEISASALDTAVDELRRQLPDLDVQPVQADYTEDIPERLFELAPPARRRVIYFPGSTISNFDPDEAIAFLARMRRIAGRAGGILIGVDLLKAEDVLLRAYDDRDGVTARFNRNLLERMRRELGAKVELDAFEHQARFNHERSRIEMHLVAVRDTTLSIAGRRFDFARGESIHTESSHKYTVESFTSLAAAAGLASRQVWTDPEGLFSMHWLENEERVSR